MNLKVSFLTQSGRPQVIPSKGLSENIYSSNPNFVLRIFRYFLPGSVELIRVHCQRRWV